MDGRGLLAPGEALLGAGALSGAAGQRVSVLQYSGRPRPEPHLQGRAGHGPGPLGEVLPESRLLGGAANTSEYLRRGRFFILLKSRPVLRSCRCLMCAELGLKESSEQESLSQQPQRATRSIWCLKLRPRLHFVWSVLSRIDTTKYRQTVVEWIWVHLLKYCT